MGEDAGVPITSAPSPVTLLAAGGAAPSIPVRPRFNSSRATSRVGDDVPLTSALTA